MEREKNSAFNVLRLSTDKDRKGKEKNVEHHGFAKPLITQFVQQKIDKCMQDELANNRFQLERRSLCGQKIKQTLEGRELDSIPDTQTMRFLTAMGCNLRAS